MGFYAFRTEIEREGYIHADQKQILMDEAYRFYEHRPALALSVLSPVLLPQIPQMGLLFEQ